MIASKVKVTPMTRQFYERPISRKKRRQLRESAVIALIDSKPAGSRIKWKEFAQAAQMSQQGVNGFLTSMIKQGKIGRTKLTPRTYTFFTHTGEHQIAPPAAGAEAIVPPPAAQPTATNDKIADLARQFAWDYNSDSLREFVKYLGERNV